MEELKNELDDLIKYIKNTEDYKKCIALKKQMENNEEIMNLIDSIKKIQKQYVKSNYDEKIKNELDYKNDELNNIPLFVVYNQSLKNVNEMIDYVKFSLNSYFDDLLNKKNKS